MPLVSRTRATLRSAEFGFFGVWVNTRVHTPRRWGAPRSAGVLSLTALVWRPLRTSCWIVGTEPLGKLFGGPVAQHPPHDRRAMLEAETPFRQTAEHRSPGRRQPTGTGETGRGGGRPPPRWFRLR